MKTVATNYGKKQTRALRIARDIVDRVLRSSSVHGGAYGNVNYIADQMLLFGARMMIEELTDERRPV